MRSTVLTNRRKARRHAVRLACQVVRERDFRLISDCILDLSMSGMVVMAAHWIFGQSMQCGDRLLVSFQLPESLVWVDTEATVTRVARGRRRGENTPALALAFDPLPRATVVEIRRALRRWPPAPPGARPGRRRTEPSTEVVLRAALPSFVEIAPTVAT